MHVAMSCVVSMRRRSECTGKRLCCSLRDGKLLAGAIEMLHEGGHPQA
jgi:hypothetical protein